MNEYILILSVINTLLLAIILTKMQSEEGDEA